MTCGIVTVISITNMSIFYFEYCFNKNVAKNENKC